MRQHFETTLKNMRQPKQSIYGGYPAIEGTYGTVQLPYRDWTGSTSSSVLDQLFGSENGCCGIINNSGTVKMWVKSSSGWKSEQLS